MTARIYPARRAIERAVSDPEARPVRCFAVLLPVWRVEIRTMIKVGEPYEVFDQYLTRGIGDAHLTTIPELAEFFAVEESLVKRAVDFLETLDHVKRSGTTLSLTGLGHESARDGVRYRIQEDHRYLYFDGYTSMPFPRAYYTGDLFHDDDSFDGRDGTRFSVLGSTAPFDHSQIDDVLTRADRGDFNVPDGLHTPRALHTGQCWLPAYLVLDGGSIGLQAFTRATEGRDHHVEQVCAEVVDALRAEDKRQSPLADWQTWLTRSGFPDVRPQRLANGILRATLPSDAFGDDKRFRLYQLGSFEVRNTSFLQLWCAETTSRKAAVAERARSMAARSRSIDDREAERLAELLEVPPLTADEIGIA
ncbi:hypothetical protein [Cryptosporangium sp. NPDC051539]|uniref:hypothetical protein n=1 Tax=Cryptosporangium sp. NPDC051539 TaxID=3363962 RepID=UPI0037A36B98